MTEVITIEQCCIVFISPDTCTAAAQMDTALPGSTNYHPLRSAIVDCIRHSGCLRKWLHASWHTLYTHDPCLCTPQVLAAPQSCVFRIVSVAAAGWATQQRRSVLGYVMALVS
jgi:hypothetical protein